MNNKHEAELHLKDLRGVTDLLSDCSQIHDSGVTAMILLDKPLLLPYG